MAATKRAILLVPSFNKREQGAALTQLAKAKVHYGEGFEPTLSDAKQSDGLTDRNLKTRPLEPDFGAATAPTAAEDEATDIYVFEDYWGDLIPD